MKLLRIKASGIPLFKDGLDVSFIAEKKVYDFDKDNLYNLFSNIYLNFTNAVCGLNASGKTSFLRLISFVMSYLNGEPINHIYDVDILGKCDKAILSLYFIADTKIFKLNTTINCKKQDDENFYAVIDEELSSKNISSIRGKKDLFHFYNKNILASRKTIDKKYLPDDVSIIIGFRDEYKLQLAGINTMPSTNFNLSSILNIANVSHKNLLSIVRFFDPTIKEFKVINTRREKIIFKFKFYNGDSFSVDDFEELEHYLSSGTIKGIPLFSSAIHAISKGSDFIIDEIENHFNKEICIMLIRLFTDKTINKQGSVLFFSTHYPEILDEFNRSDNIFIARNDNQISIDSLHNELKRDDIKKSEAYKSGLIGGTIPSYDSYLEFKNALRNI